MEQWPPPAYTLEALQGSQYDDPEPAPSPHEGPPGMHIPGVNPMGTRPHHSPSVSYDRGPGSRHEATPSLASSTSYRRPLPTPPSQASTGPSSLSPPASGRPGTGHSSNSWVDEHGQQRFTPPTGPPPAFPAIQIASPGRMDAPLPLTPSTSSSSSIRRRAQRQSEQSFPASIRSGVSSHSIRSPASFNSSEPPPWVIPYHLDNAPPSQTATLMPDNTGLHFPQLNPDPGHAVISKAFHLYFNKGRPDTAPAYGRAEPVEGCVELKDIDHVSGIEVTLKGELHVIFTRLGRPAEGSSVVLFSERRKLYTSAYSQGPGQVHQFQFVFPSHCDASATPLPPSWRLEKPGVSAKVSYTIHADVKRSGLHRKNQQLSADIEYYPRCAPPPIERARLRTLYIEENLPPMGRLAITRPNVPTPFTARISLNDPVIYPSGSTIPYTVTLSSREHTSVPASLDIEVQLIKITEVYVQGKREEIKKILADGQNLERQDRLGVQDPSTTRNQRTNTNGREVQEGGSVVIKGACQAGSEGHEMSWKVDNVAGVKYFLRFVVVPKQHLTNFPAFLERLPNFQHVEEIVLTTDSINTLLSEDEARLPALGLGSRPVRSNTALTFTSNGSSPTTGDSRSTISTGFVGSYGSSGGSGLGAAGRQDTVRPDSLYDARRIDSRPSNTNSILWGQ